MISVNMTYFYAPRQRIKFFLIVSERHPVRVSFRKKLISIVAAPGDPQGYLTAATYTVPRLVGTLPSA